MNFNRFRSLAIVLAGLALSPMLASKSFAAPALFTNPFENVAGYNDGKQSTAVVSFTAGVSGTLSGYFVGGISTNGNPVGFESRVGVYVGNPLPLDLASRNTIAAGLTYSASNFYANFGANLFGGGIQVQAGQTIAFVLKANINNSQCCGAPLNNSMHYVWSDERAPLNATLSSQLSFGSNDNAMAYSTGYTVGANGVTGQTPLNSGCTVGSGSNRDCIPTTRNNPDTTQSNGSPITTNPVPAGNYTFVGFNDWLGGPSNSYFDYALLAKITVAGVGSSSGLGPPSQVPEPGSVALVLMGLAGVVAARRNRKVAAA